MLLPLLVVAAYLTAAAASCRRRSRCYLLDYVCYKPPDDRKVSTEMLSAAMDHSERLSVPLRRFLLRVVLRSGLGEHTYAPHTVIAGREHSPTHQDCLDEMDAFFHATVAELFARARQTSLGLGPRDVDVLVVNVSTFHPAPSLASRIVRAHGMRHDVAAYNLSGMGCAAVLVAVDLARSTMHARSRSQSPRRPTLALVVSAECITPNCYAGVDRSMMLGLEQRHDGVAGLAGHGHGGATGRRVVDAVGVHGAGLLAPGADVHPAVGVHVAGPPGAVVLVAVVPDVAAVACTRRRSRPRRWRRRSRRT